MTISFGMDLRLWPPNFDLTVGIVPQPRERCALDDDEPNVVRLDRRRF